ncbi:MAG: glycoside hydrolase family 99-like domain-containing protein, partial [archaeon YNP-WB-040]|nr:glycoside hydrolase family 99-like domain-containing protein [Candidatus Culexarchaeum yellowstonense]
KIFPPEGERSYNLTPVDGEFDGLEETFTVQITNITGGREYEILILVEDSAGNTKTVEVKTPYIRQYENLGKLLYEKGFIVMSVYLPFNMRNIPHKDDVSLLGKYDTLDEIVIAKHVDWATGNGINTFILDSQNHWWTTTSMMDRVFLICRTLLSLNQINVAWLMGPSRNDFDYGTYGGEIPEWAIDLRNPWNNETFIKFVNALMTPDIVNNPNYLRINGKPVLYIWDEGAFFNQEETYIAVKRLIAERTGSEAYIIADWIPRIPTQPSDEYVQFLLEKFRGAGLRVVDAFTGWIGLHRVGLDTREYVDNYEYYYDIQLNTWRNFTKTWGKDFIVTLTPGFDNSYSWGGPQIPLPRDINKFAERLKIAIRYLDNTHPVLKIDTWNDFGEWTYIEPTRKDGFTYLEILRSILVNLTTDKTPPSVTSINWTPTRVILDKVYDINVSFTAIDDENPIAYAELHFIPVEYYYMVEKYGMRPEDYPKVFPPDKERVFVLTPVDGKFDSLKEEFSVQIRDIVGGREYKIVALVKDLAGNEKIVEVKTPYIRQFENIAKTDDIIVIADYYTWYEQITAQGSHWRGDKGEVAHSQYPLLGEYASSDPIVISKHIDLATGHGIDAFSISWWTTGNDERTWDYHSKENLDTLLRNPLIKDIEFCILYEDYGRLPVKRIIYDYDPSGNEFIPLDDPQNMQRLLEDFKFLADTYFSHPQYLKIDGKPVVQFDADRIWFGNIEEVISLLRGKIREEKGYEMYLISNVLGWYFPNAPYDVLEERNIQIVKSMDAISANGNMWLYSIEDARSDFPTFVKSLYERWYNFSRNYNSQTTLIPNLMPGEEINPYWVRDPAYVPLKRSPQLFEALIKIALKYVGTKTKITKISAFNEWGYGLEIEPSQEENFAYLQILMNYLKRR